MRNRSRNSAGEAGHSALVRTCLRNGGKLTTKDLEAFLAWQLSRRSDAEEQKKFRDDALAFPQLLVFATMQKRSPFIHLVHSAAIYPNIPRANPCWKGKIIGFLGDRTRFTTPQLIKLGKTAAWTWEDLMACMDTVAMSAYYGVSANRECLWQPGAAAPKAKITCPRMLALPPDCMVFCAKERRTPAELFTYVTQVLESVEVDPRHYTLVLDWCCVASQPGIGANANSSLLSFAMPAVMGATEHLQE